MNVELLRKVQEQILAEPKKFDMGDFDGETQCGTTHCIGGWAAKLEGLEISSEGGREALDIDKDQAERLFYVTEDDEGPGWPLQFRGEKDAWLPTPQQAVDRISHFIATEGRE